jgi:hypothetical protein
MKAIILAVSFLISFSATSGWFSDAKNKLFEDKEEVSFGHDVGYYSCWDDMGMTVFNLNRLEGFSDDFWRGYATGCELGTHNYTAASIRRSSSMSPSKFGPSDDDKFKYIVLNQSNEMTVMIWLLFSGEFDKIYR